MDHIKHATDEHVNILTSIDEIRIQVRDIQDHNIALDERLSLIENRQDNTEMSTNTLHVKLQQLQKSERNRFVAQVVYSIGMFVFIAMIIHYLTQLTRR